MRVSKQPLNQVLLKPTEHLPNLLCCGKDLLIDLRDYLLISY